jgi:mono/diheme cytochrome c family protein
MKSFVKIIFVLGVVTTMTSCFDKSQPNYQFMPNMYESVGYETYAESDAFANGIEAQLPPENTIKRGWMPYKYENTNEGRELATLELMNPLDSLQAEVNLKTGKELYDIYCGVCHGSKGDGQGILVQREKILGIPSYADPARNLTDGRIYHAIYYGLNSMGGYANQLNEKERWQVTMHVQKLKQDLSK